MHASYAWLRELTGFDLSPAEVAERLTRVGIEVEALHAKGAGLERVVVAEVRGKRPHPTKDGLTLVTVFDGAGEQEIVCGAPNVPAAGGRVLFAQLGAKLPGGVEIAERKVAGVLSRGMLTSEGELGIGDSEAGIVVLGDDTVAAPGTPVAEALGLADTIFELSLTPNRPDCLGHVGLARELGASIGRPFVPSARSGVLAGLGGAGVEAVRVRVDDPARCPRYAAAVVRGVTVGPSPFALRYRLHNLGVRPISNVVDVTNLVLFEWGHPIHAFDLARLRGGEIVVRCARPGEGLTTLDGVPRTFTPDDLLICDGEGPVAVAGVMGGANSEIGATTRDVVIECAYFEPRSVRRTSRRLGLHTDASHRFERGVDPNAVPAALEGAADAMRTLASGAPERAWVDVYPTPIRPRRVTLRSARLTRVLGHRLPADAVEHALTALGLRVSAAGDDHVAEVPTHRPDLTREEDLIEEVARLRGYDEIPVARPRVRPTRTGSGARQRLLRALRSGARAVGVHEAVTYAFVDERALEKARVPASSAEVVRLENPLSEERNVLRTSLLPGLAECAHRAQRRQVPSAALFEVGRVFARPSAADGLPSPYLARERTVFGVLLVGHWRDWVGATRPVDFYDLKAVVEAAVGAVTRERLRFTFPGEAATAWAHPRRVALVSLGEHVLGTAAMLHPDAVDGLELVGAAAYAELDVDVLARAATEVGTPVASVLPQLPASRRDVALLVGEPVPAESVRLALARAAAPLGESVELVDVYQGEQVPPGKKSLAFRITYRDADATLTDDRVDAAHAQVVAALAAEFGAQTR